MINRKPTRKYAAIKNILVLPVALFVIYAFATPDYRNSDASSGDNTISLIQPPVIIQKEIKGIITKEDGSPLNGVYIISTGTLGNISRAYSGPDGRFKIDIASDEPYLLLSATGYKSQSVKADIKSEMIIRMIKDPGAEKLSNNLESQPKRLILLDGVITKEAPPALIQKLGSEFATIISLRGKEATDKYGEAGKNGVEEVYSRKKATELGLKFPFRRFGPDEYPTFLGKSYTTFQDWVISQIKYPPEAISKSIQGRITIGYTIGSDGSVTNVQVEGNPDPLLAEAVKKAIYSSPKWEPALKPEARVPFFDGMDLKFELPGRIIKDDAFVVVEKMPMYPGGDAELLRYISNNAKYPEAAKADKAEGKVIVRFMVTAYGNAEDVTVLKGVHPLLDAEAVRVVSTLSGFEPGTQGGKPVNVWYMVPINFVMPKTESDQEQPISIRSEDGRKPLVVVDNMVTSFHADNIPIDSKNIESVTILKDKTATDKYGEKAKDGVIEIITKKDGVN